jgi:hypothetical protein
MLSTQSKRSLSSNGRNLNKTVAIMANSKAGDLVGAKIMQNLKAVSGVCDFDFFGYGGAFMKKEGMSGAIEVDMNDMMNKEFLTSRKTKTYSEVQYSTKYNFLNFINKHFVRATNNVLDQFDKVDVAKRIYQARPSVILSIDNEQIAFHLGDQIKGKRTPYLKNF